MTERMNMVIPVDKVVDEINSVSTFLYSKLKPIPPGPEYAQAKVNQLLALGALWLKQISLYPESERRQLEAAARKVASTMESTVEH